MRVNLRGYVKFFVENSLLLIIGTTAGLLWANSYFEQYSSISDHLRFLINDVGMAFFFGIAALAPRNLTIVNSLFTIVL